MAVTPVIRNKDLPRVTVPTAGDTVTLDGVTTRSIAVENFVREIPAASPTYWYRDDGDDGNTGQGNTVLTAFRTVQKAYDTICDKLDLRGVNALIQCGSAPGTVFTGGIVTSKSPVGNSGAASIVWDGNGSIVRTTNGACLDVGAANGFGGYPQLTFQNIRFETLVSGNCINARGGLILGGAGVVFGDCAGNHVFGGHLGQMGLSSYEVAGSPGLFQSHIYGYSGFFFFTEGATTTISAAVTVQTWVTLIQGSIGLMGGQTFVNPGNVTGAKFLLAPGTRLDTGGGLSYLPGTIAGTLMPGAFYDNSYVFGYMAGLGDGGSVAQATSKSTGVTLSKATGQITMSAAALAAGTIVSFVLTNTLIAATDVLVMNHIGAGAPGGYTLNAQCAAGSATINVRNNTAGSLSEAIVIQYVLIKGSAT